MKMRFALLTLNVLMFFGIQLLGGTPLLISPEHSASLATNEIVLRWKAPEASSDRYDVQIAFNGDFSTIVAEQKGVSGTMLFFNASERDRTYFWRVRLSESNEWSATNSFTVIAQLPTVPALIAPAHESTSLSLSPTLRWNSMPETVYQVQLSRSQNFEVVLATMTVPSTGTKAEVIVGGLEYFSTYFWRVRGRNSTGVSSWSEVYSFSTIGTSLGSPMPTTPPNNATLAFTASLPLGWNGVEHAEAYDVQIATENSFKSIVAQTENFKNTTLTFSNVLDNTQYFWRVRARNGESIGEWSSVSSFRIGQGTSEIALPVAPLLATPENGAHNQKTTQILAWQKAQGAQRYDIEVSPTPQFYTVTHKASSVVESSTTVSSLSPGMTYYWRVRSVNQDGIGNWSSASSFTTGNAPYSPALTLPFAEQVNVPATTTLQWESSSNATEYEVQVSATSNFRELVYEAKQVKGTQIDANLPPNTLLFWRVRAVNEFGAGTWSSWRFFRTVGSSVSSVEEEPMMLTNISVSPNPTSSMIKISYTVPAKGQVMLFLMDEMGNPVMTLVNAEQNIGSYEVPVSTNVMEQGVYLYHLNYKGIIHTGKIVLVR